MEESPFEHGDETVEKVGHRVRPLERLSGTIKRLYPSFNLKQFDDGRSFWLGHPPKLTDRKLQVQSYSNIQNSENLQLIRAFRPSPGMVR